MIRAACETIQDYASTPEALLPKQTEDDLIDVPRIDEDDLDMDLRVEMLQRTGRLIGDASSNPCYGKLKTVADIVYFVNAQPLVNNT